MIEARFYEKLSGGRVQCRLCPFECAVPDGKAGHCRVRLNRGGTLYTAIHNRYSGISVDPVEKKPLFHFFPGRGILSVGTMGCNFRCRFCQNSDISQSAEIELAEVAPVDLLKTARAQNAVGIAFTYTEPSIWIETILEVAPVFRTAGLANVLVTNGYFNREPLDAILPYVDAMNIDVKAFRNDFYAKVCGAKLDPVLRNVEYLAGKIHLELTMLLVPGLNDDPREIGEFVDWVAGMSRSIPVHFSRYFPRYRMDTAATPEKTIRTAWETAKKKLDFVYAGNIRIPGAEDTSCPSCGNLLVSRSDFVARKDGLKGNACLKCGTVIAGRFAG